MTPHPYLKLSLPPPPKKNQWRGVPAINRLVGKKYIFLRLPLHEICFNHYYFVRTKIQEGEKSIEHVLDWYNEVRILVLSIVGNFMIVWKTIYPQFT